MLEAAGPSTASCVALGLPWFMALSEPTDGDVAFASSSRTPKAKVVSAHTIRGWLRGRVFTLVHGVVQSATKAQVTPM